MCTCFATVRPTITAHADRARTVPGLHRSYDLYAQRNVVDPGIRVEGIAIKGLDRERDLIRVEWILRVLARVKRYHLIA